MKQKVKKYEDREFEKKEYIKPDEFKYFLSQIPNSDIVFKLMFKIGYFLGLRPCEYSQIEIKDFNFQNNTLCVRLGKTDKIKQREVPINLMIEIQSYIALNIHRFVNGFIFIGYNGKPYEINTISRKFRYYAKKIGWTMPYKVESSLKVQNVGRILHHKRLYSLRVSFITNMYLIYGDIKKVSRIIGHELSRTTEIYIKNIIFDEDLTINELYDNGINLINEKIKDCNIIDTNNKSVLEYAIEKPTINEFELY